MGFFSWRTSDTNESIPNWYSNREPITVRVITKCGQEFIESNYEGYGDFGGKDIFELIAELNGKKTRNDGINLVFKDNPTGEFSYAAQQGILLPKIVTKNYSGNFDNVPYPKPCEYQGYFYNNE